MLPLSIVISFAVFVSLLMKYFIFLFSSILSLSAMGQQDTLQPPFKRFPTLPPIQLLLGDSVTKYTKKDFPSRKPVLIMLFSPDCSHCQHTAEEMQQYKEDLKDIQIVMATMHSITEMNEFVKKYKLNELKNVVTGKDIYYILTPFYGIKNLPYLAMYNKKGNLILGFEGSMSIQKVLETFKANK